MTEQEQNSYQKLYNDVLHKFCEKVNRDQAERAKASDPQTPIGQFLLQEAQRAEIAAYTNAIETTALSRLLLQKGLISEQEYWEATIICARDLLRVVQVWP